MADDKGKKSAKPANKPAAEKKPADPKKAKAKPEKDKAAAKPEAAKPEKKPEPLRAPADPRMKFAKKLQGRFLPKGPLRDRHRELLARWRSNPEHGDVTVEELKSLYQDWMAVRRKPARTTA